MSNRSRTIISIISIDYGFCLIRLSTGSKKKMNTIHAYEIQRLTSQNTKKQPSTYLTIYSKLEHEVSRLE